MYSREYAFTANVTLDFSLLVGDRLDGDSASMLWSDVPAQTPLWQLVDAIAFTLDVQPTQVGLLNSNDGAVNPTTSLDSHMIGHWASFKIMPRDYCGGNGDEAGCSADAPVESEVPEIAPPTREAHPGRRAEEEQPEPEERPYKLAHQRWYCKALVAKARTGKADGWDREEREFHGATKQAVLAARAEFIHDYVHAPQRKRKGGGLPQPPPRAQRLSRSSSPATFAESKSNRGPSSEQARAGPGRGHRSEPASSSLLAEPQRVQSVKEGANWFEQAAAREAWRTQRIAQLETQLMASMLRTSPLTWDRRPTPSPQSRHLSMLEQYA